MFGVYIPKKERRCGLHHQPQLRIRDDGVHSSEIARDVKKPCASSKPLSTAKHPAVCPWQVEQAPKPCPFAGTGRKIKTAPAPCGVTEGQRWQPSKKPVPPGVLERLPFHLLTCSTRPMGFTEANAPAAHQCTLLLIFEGVPP
jgi:hypothetical protein